MCSHIRKSTPIKKSIRVLCIFAPKEFRHIHPPRNRHGAHAPITTFTPPICLYLLINSFAPSPSTASRHQFGPSHAIRTPSHATFPPSHGSRTPSHGSTGHPTVVFVAPYNPAPLPWTKITFPLAYLPFPASNHPSPRNATSSSTPNGQPSSPPSCRCSTGILTPYASTSASDSTISDRKSVV